MSHAFEETYPVYNESTRVARKEHQCSACKETIRKGDTYVRIFIVFEDTEATETLKRCARCQTIHLHLRGKAPGELWPDERLNCGEEYEAHWGEKPPDEVAALAFALPGEISLEKGEGESP